MPVQDLTPLQGAVTNQAVGAGGPYPALKFFPEETGGQYFEFREVTGEGWNVENASYNVSSGQWLLVDPTKPARALVSSAPTGKTSFRLSGAGVQPCVWVEKWSITDGGVANMSLSVTSLPGTVDLSALGIFNVLHYGAIPLVNTVAQGQANATAFQNAINDAALFGGTVLVPSVGAFYFDLTGAITTLAINAQNKGTTVLGTSATSILHVTTSGNLFTVSGGDLGCEFRNLKIVYDVPLTGIAIHQGVQTTGGQSGGQATSVENVFFEDCPIAIYSDDSLLMSVKHCTITFSAQQNGTGILMDKGTEQFSCVNTIIRNGHSAPLTPLNNTGINIGECDEVRFYGLQMADFTLGIILGPQPHTSNLKSVTFDTCSLEIDGTAIYMQTGAFSSPGGNQSILNVDFVNCDIKHSQWHGRPYDSQPGVYIDTNGSANQNIDSISFVNCNVFNFGGAGVYITSGKHFQFVGGRYSSNNLGANGTFAGISLVGVGDGTHFPGSVQMSGVSCAGIYDNLTAQPYGIYIDNGATNIFIDATNVRENSVQGILVGGVGSAVEITNSPGYNDLGTTVAGPGAIGAWFTVGSPFTGPQIGTTPYFGPIQIMFTTGAVTGTQMNGKATHLTQGTFIIQVGNNFEIDGGAPGFFLAVGI